MPPKLPQVVSVSDVHNANILISVTPAVSVQFPVTLGGGTGHNKNAKLAIGGAEITPASPLAVISANGTVQGTLTSSDTEGAATVSCDQSSTAVGFCWDNYEDDDAWEFDQDYIMPGTDVNFSFYMALNYVPIDNHSIIFVIEKVYYTDQNGVEQETASNVPGSPYDLGSWADFTEPGAPSDSNGTVTATIHLKANNLGTATWISIRAYDMSVFTQ